MTPYEEIFLDNKIDGHNRAEAWDPCIYILAARQGRQLHQAITDLRARPDGEGVDDGARRCNLLSSLFLRDFALRTDTTSV